MIRRTVVRENRSATRLCPGSTRSSQQGGATCYDLARIAVSTPGGDRAGPSRLSEQPVLRSDSSLVLCQSISRKLASGGCLARSPRVRLSEPSAVAGIDHYWRWQTVRPSRPQADGPILDLCTGTGDLALAYLRGQRARRADRRAPTFCHEMLVLGERKADLHQAATAGSRFSRPTPSSCRWPTTIFRSSASPSACGT